MKKIEWKNIGLDKLILLLAAGILLLVIALPSGSSKEQSNESKNSAVIEPILSNTNDTSSYEEQLEARLKEILSQVKGVGEVDVMITLKSSEELVIQTDSSKGNSITEESDSQGGSRKVTETEESVATVLIDSGGGEQVPYVLKELSPQIAGVLISAQGGGNSVIKNEIYEAVEALFDVPVHKIKVLEKQ